MTLELALGLALCLGIGLSLGLLGGGGSIITVPVLVYALRVEPREAVAMSLAVVGATSLIGAALHHRRGTVRIPQAVLFAGAGVVSSFLGARLTYRVSPQVLLLCFAALMLAVGIRMAVTGSRPSGERRPARSSARTFPTGSRRSRCAASSRSSWWRWRSSWWSPTGARSASPLEPGPSAVLSRIARLPPPRRAASPPPDRARGPLPRVSAPAFSAGSLIRRKGGSP